MALLKSPIVYMSTSFVLFLIAPLLISLGTTGAPRPLLWLGLAALCIAGLIPPLQRLVCGAESGSKPERDEENTR
jgi:hypothetical protein